MSRLHEINQLMQRTQQLIAEEIAERNRIVTPTQIPNRPNFQFSKPPHFSQVDPKWASRILHKRKFAEVGCLVCAFASKIAYENHNSSITPVHLDDFLDKNRGYLGLTNSGSSEALIWNVAMAWARTLGSHYQTMAITPTNNHVVSPHKPEIMEVRTSRNTTHFVLMLNSDTGEIMDPGTAQTGTHTLKSRGYTPSNYRILS